MKCGEAEIEHKKALMKMSKENKSHGKDTLKMAKEEAKEAKSMKVSKYIKPPNKMKMRGKM